MLTAVENIKNKMNPNNTRFQKEKPINHDDDGDDAVFAIDCPPLTQEETVSEAQELHHHMLSLVQNQNTKSLHIRYEKNDNHLARPRTNDAVVVVVADGASRETNSKHLPLALVQGLQQNTSLSQLHLESFGDNNNHSCCASLNDSFLEITRMPQLDSLALTHCPNWRRLLVKALSQRKAPLRNLHLASCALSKTDLKLLVGQLTGNPFLRNSLEELSICDVSTTTATTTEVALDDTINDVLASLQRLPSLRKLTLVHSGLNQKTVEAIVPLLRKDSPLRHLTMHGYAWDNHTSQMLGAALEHSRLESLSLGFVDRSFAVADLVQVLKTHNCCLNDVELASIELEPMKGVDELSYWCKLNKWGRATTRRVDLPKSCFVALMTKQRFDVELSYGLLREVPHMCRQH